jgi:MarR family transcriptional regulator, transcriptional regulator for hemolysin
MRQLGDELIVELLETSRLLRTYIDQQARGLGTTRAQWDVLEQVRDAEGSCQIRLAEKLGLQPISLVPLLNKLVEVGLLERRADPADRRVQRLHLTQGGRLHLINLELPGEAVRARVFAELEPGQAESMSAVLCELKRRVRKLLTGKEPTGVTIGARLRGEKRKAASQTKTAKITTSSPGRQGEQYNEIAGTATNIKLCPEDAACRPPSQALKALGPPNG